MQDVFLGVAGLIVGSIFGVGGFLVGRRPKHPNGLDERFVANSALASRVSWLLTLAAMTVMWGLVQFRAVTSAAVAIGALYLFSIAAYVSSSVFVDRRR